MEKEFVPYELALRLKAIGFDKPCFTFFSSKGVLQTGLLDIQRGFLPEDLNKGIIAPTFSQAFRWFREKYRWVAEIHGSLQQNHFYANLLLQSKGEVRNIKMCDTYEEAELACLEKLIEIVESETK